MQSMRSTNARANKHDAGSGEMDCVCSYGECSQRSQTEIVLRDEQDRKHKARSGIVTNGSGNEVSV